MDRHAPRQAFGRLSLHTWTLDTTPLDAAIGAAKAAGFDAIELRHIDFERGHAAGLDDAALIAKVQSHGLPISMVGVEYGWMFAEGAEVDPLLASFETACRRAVALGCGMLMSSVGQTSGTVKAAGDRTRVAADIAASHGLKLALEFQAFHPFVNTIEVMQDIVASAARSNVGLLLDTYHLHHSGRIGAAFDDIPAQQIFAVQFSDVPAASHPDAPQPTDRLPPGRGVIAWPEVFALFAEKNYDGFLCYEAPNPVTWRRAPEAAAQEAVAAARRFIARPR